MNELGMLRTMARYNRWMNERLFATCANMSDDERKQDVKAFFGSIHGTLNHILLADRVWLGRLSAQGFTVRSLDQELYADFPELARERGKTDSDIEDLVASMSPEDLQQTLTYQPISKKTTATFTRGLILLHLFNHQTHHRGQITSLISQLGYDFGVTDLIACPGDIEPN